MDRGGHLAAKSAAVERTGIPDQIAGVIVGLFLGFDDHGNPLIDYPGNPTATPMRARAATHIGVEHRGRDAALLFEDGNPGKPIIVGLMQQSHANKLQQWSVDADGQTLELTAERQITLRCGDASITLTRSGKVLIRGKYILSRSVGVNMVKGGIVRLN